MKNCKKFEQGMVKNLAGNTHWSFILFNKEYLIMFFTIVFQIILQPYLEMSMHIHDSVSLPVSYTDSLHPPPQICSESPRHG